MTELTRAFDWSGPSGDPNDEQFGDVVSATSLDAAAALDAVLVGEPTDRAVIGRSGAAEGPAALRRELAGAKTHSFDRGAVANLGDLGDVSIPADATVAAIQDAVRDVTSRIHDLDVFPVFLGGDNSLTYPNLSPLLEGPGRVAAINLDAHLDCREVRGDPTSGTPYRQLFEAGLDDLVVVGARDFETSTAYADYLDDQGGAVVTAGDVDRDPAAAAASAIEAVADADRVYLSVDLDVLDAAAAPGVSAPTPGGLSTAVLYGLLAEFSEGLPLVGFEVVECAPPLDPSNRTARAGSRAIAHLLASECIHD